MNTYTWKIKEIKVKTIDVDGVTLENAIYQTYWEKEGIDENGNSGTFSGATPLPLDNINPETFTDLGSLSEEDVIGWVKAEVLANPTYVDHINAVIQDQIDSSGEDVKLPWGA